MIETLSKQHAAIFNRLPPKMQKRIRLRCYRKALCRDWQAWIGVAVAGLCGGAGTGLGLAIGGSVWPIILAGLFAGFGGVNFQISMRAIVRPYLEQALTAV